LLARSEFFPLLRELAGWHDVYFDTSSGLTGTFNNFPDGGTITAGPNTYQANYEAGSDGHDLTLTVL